MAIVASLRERPVDREGRRWSVGRWGRGEEVDGEGVKEEVGGHRMPPHCLKLTSVMPENCHLMWQGQRGHLGQS